MSNVKNLLQVCLFSFLQSFEGKRVQAIHFGCVHVILEPPIKSGEALFLLRDIDDIIERRNYNTLDEFKSDIPKLVLKCEEIIALAQKESV